MTEQPVDRPVGSETAAVRAVDRQPEIGSRVGRPSPGRRGAGGAKQGSFWRELPILLVIAVVLALLIKTFLVQAFFIPSGSMEQTLHVHDRVLVNKLADHTGNPQRGDIVVFNTAGLRFSTGAGTDYVPCGQANPVVSGVRAVQRFIGIGTCGEDDFIKRVIAVPGDRIQCCTAQGQVILNGHPLNETYIFNDGSQPEIRFCATAAGQAVPQQTGSACGTNAAAVVVPKGMYWVMGDHRNDSDDSRYNGFVPRDKIVGRAFVRIYPLNRLGFLRVPKTFADVGATATGVAGTPVLAAPVIALPLVAGRLRRRRGRTG